MNSSHYEIKENEIEEKYIVGESSPDKIKNAVKLEYEKGVKPMVSTEKNNIKNYAIESYASNILIYAMEKHGEGVLKRCNDGCLADAIFSPDGENFIGIQIKSTTNICKNGQKKNSGWSFAILGKNYRGFLMYFRSLIDGKGWLVPFNDIIKKYKCKNNLLITESTHSKIDWKKYEVTNHNVITKIYEYYNLNKDLIIEKKEYFTSLVCKNHELEHNLRIKIEYILSKTSLEIKRPEFENMSYDMILGELKIQEKTGSYDKSQDVRISLYRNVGKEIKPYVKESFDILLIHLHKPNDKKFYFIPMDNLIEQGFIDIGNNNKGNFCFMVYPFERKMIHNKIKKEWAQEFLLNYEDPNLIQKITALYNKQLNHIPGPIELINPVIWDIKCNNFENLLNKWNFKRTYPKDNTKINIILFDKKIVYRILTNNNGKRKNLHLNINYSTEKNPYKLDDFDYLICKTPESYDHLNIFYIFPSIILLKNKILKTENYSGKYAICIPPPDPNYKTSKRSHTWVNDFIFKYDDPNIKNTVLNLFEKYSI